MASSGDSQSAIFWDRLRLLFESDDEQPRPREEPRRGIAITVCVVLSFILWLSLTLGEERTQTFQVPVEVAGTPEGKALAEVPPSHVQITAQGRGLNVRRGHLGEGLSLRGLRHFHRHLEGLRALLPQRQGQPQNERQQHAHRDRNAPTGLLTGPRLLVVGLEEAAEPVPENRALGVGVRGHRMLNRSGQNREGSFTAGVGLRFGGTLMGGPGGKPPPPMTASEPVWRTVYGLRLRGSRAERLLHSPGSSPKA